VAENTPQRELHNAFHDAKKQMQRMGEEKTHCCKAIWLIDVWLNPHQKIPC